MSESELYVAETRLPVSAEAAFRYHERPGCLGRLIPPWESVEIEHSDHSLSEGSRVTLKSSLFGVPFRWVAEHTRYDPPRGFADRQVSGPFSEWRHAHEFESIGQQESTLIDRVEYRLPGGATGQWLGESKARQTIESMFAYRHRVTLDDLTLASTTPLAPLTVAVSGASGLIGGKLCTLLTLLGHRVQRIVRSPSADPGELAVWSDSGDAERLAEVDAVVHLAGKPIAAGRWSDSVKREIRESRVEKTRALAEALAAAGDRPRVLVSASATGIYGDRGDERLTETSQAGEGFLADVARDWEAASGPAAEAGIRVVNPRFGIVLSPEGGALKKMLLPAKAFGGALGSGRQWWSWVAADDVLGAIYHAIASDSMSGPVNVVSPQPISNRDFAATLGRVLGRPALLPAPAAALRMMLGEMADSLLLASQRVTPERLNDSGYRFRFTDLERCLRYLLGVERLESVR